MDIAQLESPQSSEVDAEDAPMTYDDDEWRLRAVREHEAPERRY